MQSIKTNTIDKIGNLGQDVESLLAEIRRKKQVSAVLATPKKYLIASTLSSLDVVVYVCNDYFAAGVALEQLSAILGEQAVAYVPHRDDVLTAHKGQSRVADFDRLKAFDKIAKGATLVVTTVAALTQRCVAGGKFVAKTLCVKTGQELPKDFLARLIEMGYQKNDQVEERGQFSTRGDILDIWSPHLEPIRIDLFGDTVESIKHFDSETKRSTRSLDTVCVIPCSEWMGSERVDKYLAQLAKYKECTMAQQLCVDLECGRIDTAMSILWGLDQAGGDTQDFATVPQFVEYFLQGKKLTVVYDDCKKCSDALEIAVTEHNQRAKQMILANNLVPTLVALVETPFAFGDHQLAYHQVLSQNRIFEPKALHNFGQTSVQNYSHDYRVLLEDLLQWQNSEYQVLVCLDEAQKRADFSKWVTDNGLKNFAGLQVVDAGLHYGDHFFGAKKIILGKFDLYKKAFAKKIKRAKQSVFTQPDLGDFVVHHIHGVGVYEGVQKQEFVEGAARDYVVIRYRDNDLLYVPVENMDTLARFVSKEEPHLHRLGGQEFAKVKDRVRASVKRLAFDLVALYANRQKASGHKYESDQPLYQEFENQFEFEPTPDQKSATQDALQDLRQGKVMDRLLCGDVGYGKTEVAMRAAFRVLLEGHQVAFVSPTTILAKQHYLTVKKRMERFGVRVASMSRLDGAKQIANTVQQVGQGAIDIVVGTHRALSKDLVFKNLGLLVLDEEQRFGVGDKEKIKQLKNTVGVLSMSATPIPRTLHMSLSGIRDISIIDTPPTNRIPVQTYVAEYTESLVVDAIGRELGRGGSVFIVYNRVEHMEPFACGIQNLVPSAKVIFAHGQMDKQKLEDAILSFGEGRHNVLVASTIIENGIDMPNANTIIVVGAERLGLAQMYQLRGRVGRSDRQAYAYFTFDDGKTLSETASKRLRAISEFTDLGAGYKLAMRDLEIRGAGNVLGREQHGHMDKVGYDLYCRLLQQAVEEQRDGVVKSSDHFEIKVSTDLSAHIPHGYLADEQSRLNLYSRVARLQSQKERQDLLSEMLDIYGTPPKQAQNLLLIGLAKNLAQKQSAVGVVIKKNVIGIKFEKIKDIPKSLQGALQKGQCVLDPQTAMVKWGSVGAMLAMLSPA
ncbi:MAG: transcription-repair coupling factor [Firmicutes bacterium]|nr:transcription-repair coupling factor [Bacillota bacterium]